MGCVSSPIEVIDGRSNEKREREGGGGGGGCVCISKYIRVGQRAKA